MALLNENEPVKCKDCSAWWRGLEHRCSNIDRITDLIVDEFKKTSTPPRGYDFYPRLYPSGYAKGSKPKKDKIFCKVCGFEYFPKFGHTCISF